MLIGVDVDLGCYQRWDYTPESAQTQSSTEFLQFLPTWYCNRIFNHSVGPQTRTGWGSGGICENFERRCDVSYRHFWLRTTFQLGNETFTSTYKHWQWLGCSSFGTDWFILLSGSCILSHLATFFKFDTLKYIYTFVGAGTFIPSWTAIIIYLRLMVHGSLNIQTIFLSFVVHRRSVPQ